MKSHSYLFSLPDLARMLLGLLIPLIVIAAFLRGGAASGLFPSPWPALDLDRTILTHQAEASRTRTGADLLLLGDSSCLMGVSARELERTSAEKHRVQNLGTFMYVGLDGYTTLLARCASTDPGRLRTVVLLLHPEMLRGVQPVRHYLDVLSDYYAGNDAGETGSFYGQLCGLFGLDVVRNRFLSRVPLPLPKEYGRYYGFNLDLYQFMDREHGSAVDPHRYLPAPGQGNAEYRLSLALKPGSQALVAALPPAARLVVGLTPVPESFAPPGYAAQWRSLLGEWGQWMRADALLTNLPPTLPDDCFASTMHLNQKGALRYTALLARSLNIPEGRPALGK